jgi:hypothetical protein
VTELLEQVGELPLARARDPEYAVPYLQLA